MEAAREDWTGESRRDVGWWLLGCAALIFAMVLLGGVTRLTGSGLSMVAWEPISGILPPLGDAAWDAEFTRYRESPEFRIVNAWMEVDDFKRIFWLEWGHRLRGRIVTRLVTSVQAAPLQLSRKLSFAEDSIEVRDRIEGAGARQLEHIELARAATPLHMGSARYFHPSELSSCSVTPPAAAGTLLEDLARAGSAERSFRISFPREPGPGEVTVRELAARPAEDQA